MRVYDENEVIGDDTGREKKQLQNCRDWPPPRSLDNRLFFLRSILEDDESGRRKLNTAARIS